MRQYTLYVTSNSSSPAAPHTQARTQRDYSIWDVELSGIGHNKTAVLSQTGVSMVLGQPDRCIQTGYGTYTHCSSKGFCVHFVCEKESMHVLRRLDLVVVLLRSAAVFHNFRKS